MLTILTTALYYLPTFLVFCFVLLLFESGYYLHRITTPSVPEEARSTYLDYCTDFFECLHLFCLTFFFFNLVTIEVKLDSEYTQLAGVASMCLRSHPTFAPKTVVPCHVTMTPSRAPDGQQDVKCGNKGSSRKGVALIQVGQKLNN